jgi:hypothetical protein
MNDKKEIVLGFCRKIGSDEHYKISEDYLPSKIGGSPVY